VWVARRPWPSLRTHIDANAAAGAARDPHLRRAPEASPCTRHHSHPTLSSTRRKHTGATRVMTFSSEKITGL